MSSEGRKNTKFEFGDAVALLFSVCANPVTLELAVATAVLAVAVPIFRLSWWWPIGCGLVTIASAIVALVLFIVIWRNE